MDRWYLLHTKPRIEKRVAIFLEQRDIQVFLPELAHTNVNGQTRKKAFFPGYLFASLDLSSVDPSIWRWTPGLRYIVKYGDQPVPVSDEVITLITQKIGKMELLALSPSLRFEPGDTVRIKNGPFEDLIAIFEGPTHPTTRVRVLLSTLNRAMRLSVQVDNLEKAPAQAVATTARRSRRTRGRGRPIN
jgi:transcriptional antiterminator RfaH